MISKEKAPFVSPVRMTRTIPFLFPWQNRAFPRCRLWVMERTCFYKHHPFVLRHMIIRGRLKADSFCRWPSKWVILQLCHSYLHVLCWLLRDFLRFYMGCTERIAGVLFIVWGTSATWRQKSSIGSTRRRLDSHRNGFDVPHCSRTKSASHDLYILYVWIHLLNTHEHKIYDACYFCKSEV